MTIALRLLLLSVFFITFGTIFGSFPGTTSAQTCMGSVNCKRYGIRTVCNGGIRDGESCSSSTYCIGGSCESEQYIADRDTKGCNDNPTLACRAGCQELGAGWEPDGGGCIEVPPPPPPPPPAVRYNCNTSNYTCYNAGSSGYYSTYSSCSNNCKPEATPPPCTSCGCPGQPPCEVCNTCGCPGYPPCGGCTNESQCGDITQYDCCNNSCVPEGTQCGGGCSSIATYQAVNVWVRVVSNEPGIGTVAWKGSQSNDPIQTTTWSGDALAADGYFQNYKPYQNGGVKAFDRTRNKIDSKMRVKVTNNPIGYHTTVNKCNETVTYTDIPQDPAHGIVWSNHFCGAGWAWEQQSGKPLPAKTSDTCGKDYYTEMSGSCGETPDLLPVEDRDGCSGLFRQPLDQPETVRSYHEELVPLLETADAAHPADLNYDGYWSMAYQAWEQWRESRAIDSVIELTPPNNYYCAGVRWWGKNEQDEDPSEASLSIWGTSMLDGTCTVRFNPKKYSNLLVMELGKKPIDESCTVQLENPYTAPNILASDITVSKKSDFVAHVTGYSTEPTAPLKEKVNLWIANDDFTRINTWDYTNALGQRTILDGKFTEIFSGGRYYYRHDDPTGLNQQCYTNADAACSMSVNITDTTMALFNQDILPADDYHVFCDVVEPSSVCSGNPACSMNGGSLACYGYNDCAPDTTTPNDHATVTAACVPSCTPNSCNATAYDDGCGGQCPVDPNYGAPPAPTINEPTQNDVITPGSNGAPANYYNVQWYNSSSLTDSFEILVYPQSSFSTPELAHAAYFAGGQDNLIYYTTQSVSVNTLNIPVLSGQNWKMRLAIRARNTGPCASMSSAWTTADFDLISSISGSIQVVTSNQCSGGTTITTPPNNYPDVQDGTLIEVSDVTDQIQFFTSNVFGKGFGLSNLVSGVYSANFLPYSPSMWFNPGPMTVKLRLNNPDPSKAYVCAECNKNGSDYFTCRTGGFSGTSHVPQSGLNFYVQLANLSNDPWFQTWGGLLFSMGAVHSPSPIVENVADSCRADQQCDSHLIQTISGPNSTGVDPSRDQSAGIAIVNGNASINAGKTPGGFYANRTNNERVTGGHNQSGVTKENYQYFIKNIDNIPESCLNGVCSTTIINTLGQLSSQATPQGDTVHSVDGNLTINIDMNNGGKWSIPGNTKHIVFVPGDLTINALNTSSNADQQQLIGVPSGSFLAFIVKGNITISDSVGYSGDANLDALQTPNIEGVFIANGQIIIDSYGTTNPADRKFVGAGSFVGWTNVDLQRDFNNGGLRKELHNTTPTETFIHRPDFIVNVPSVLQRSQLTWQEVN